MNSTRPRDAERPLAGLRAPRQPVTKAPIHPLFVMATAEDKSPPVKQSAASFLEIS